MLTGICPGCGLRADLDVFCVQADANKALAAALELPPVLGGRILRYLRLFSPPNKTLALGKSVRLLVELADTVNSAQVSRRGIAYVATLDLWAAALDAVLQQPPESLPLTNHHYLFQIAWNIADRAAARRERLAEERLRHGQRSIDSPPASVPSPADAGSVPSVSAADGTAFSSPTLAQRQRNASHARELLKKIIPQRADDAASTHPPSCNLE